MGKQRQRCQEENIIPLCSVPFRQYGALCRQIASGSFNQLHQCGEGFPGTDYIVHDRNPFATEEKMQASYDQAFPVLEQVISDLSK